jgi:hypothetical protein
MLVPPPGARLDTRAADGQNEPEARLRSSSQQGGSGGAMALQVPSGSPNQ